MCKVIENNAIISLDLDQNHTNENFKKSFEKIQGIISSIDTFYNMDDCMNYLKTIKHKRIFMIITDSFYERYVHGTNLFEEESLNISVHLFCNDSLKEKSWENAFRNFKGTFSDIDSIVDTIKNCVYPSKIHQSSNSIVSTVNHNFDDLDSTYIYSKILIESIFKIEYDAQSIEKSFNFCRTYYADNSATVKAIDEFEKDYKNHSPIWWYTKESSVYRLLSNAVRTNDVNIIIAMGFFLKDLHDAIKSMYLKTDRTAKITLYRGQGMSLDDFNKFNKQNGELYSCNWFLSASTDSKVALHFAHNALLDDATIGILFEMDIDPTICSIPFAHVDHHGYYSEAESEVLICMNSIFRIGEMNQLGDRLWKVHLTSVCAVHEASAFLTHYITNEIYSVSAWHSLAILLYKMGKYDKALESFEKALQVVDNRDDKKFFMSLSSNFNNIGLVSYSMEKYHEALRWYQEALEIQKCNLPSDHVVLATLYNNIGTIYQSLGDYANALSNFQQALELRLKSSSSNNMLLVHIYSNIGLVDESNGNYSSALSHYQKAYELQTASLPPNHPYFTISFNNFAGIYSLMGDYSKTLLYYTKTVDIQETSLPANHPSLSLAYSNIGYVYQLMGKYTIALSFYEEACKIQKIIYSSNSIFLATTYNNIALIHRTMGNYANALSYFEKVLIIERDRLAADHPSLASTYNNLGTVYQSMKEYSTSLEYYEKALTIWQKSLPSNHVSLATVYNNIGSLYDSMTDYKQALSYYKKVVEIQQTSSSNNHLNLASTYNNMGETCRVMGDFPNAISYYQKALEIEEKQLSAKHPSLAVTLSNMAVAFEAHNHQYEKAYEYARRAFDIVCVAYASNSSDIIIYQKYQDYLREKLLPIN